MAKRRVEDILYDENFKNNKCFIKGLRSYYCKQILLSVNIPLVFLIVGVGGGGGGHFPVF